MTPDGVVDHHGNQRLLPGFARGAARANQLTVAHEALKDGGKRHFLSQPKHWNLDRGEIIQHFRAIQDGFGDRHFASRGFNQRLGGLLILDPDLPIRFHGRQLRLRGRDGRLRGL